MKYSSFYFLQRKATKIRKMNCKRNEINLYISLARNCVKNQNVLELILVSLYADCKSHLSGKFQVASPYDVNS